MKYKVHNEAMRKADRRFDEERDRRYTEVNVEKEKALKIKETADLTALELAREGQTYKDERNDSQREQSLKSTGIYATQTDLATAFSKSEKTLAMFMEEMRTALKPLVEHISADKGADKSTTKLYANITVLVLLIGAAYTIINYLL